MADHTEQEEGRYIRAVAKRMPVQPERLLNHLKAHGFALIYANRDEGVNEIHYLRTSSGLSDFFDILKIKSNIFGEGAWVEVYQSIIPSERCPCVKSVGDYVPATRYGYSVEDVRFRNPSDVKTFERRVCDAVPELFATLHEQEGETLYRETATARDAADRYLATLKPGRNLTETLARLKAEATSDQWRKAQHYVRNELLAAFNLDDFRVIWDIAGLCQVLYWERDGVPFRGFSGEISYVKANTDDIEAHRRFQILASRLSREAGWPTNDPLVPIRADIEESVQWREGKPSRVAELFDEYLAASDHRCDCGKQLYYVSHRIREGDPPVAEVLSRCNNGHEETTEMAGSLQGLR